MDMAVLFNRELLSQTNYLDNPGFTYLRQRGLDNLSILEKQLVGYCSEKMSLRLRAELISMGHKDILEEIHPLVDAKKAFPDYEQAHRIFDRTGRAIMRNRIICPIIRNSRVEALYMRDYTDSSEFPHRYSNDNFLGVYNLQNNLNSRTIIITESIFDTLVLLHGGFENSVSLCCSNYPHNSLSYVSEFRKGFVEKIRKCRASRVFICFDNDYSTNHQGMKMSLSMATACIDAGYSTRIVMLPKDKDINELFLSFDARSPDNRMALFQESFDRTLDDSITVAEVEAFLSIEGMNLSKEAKESVELLMRSLVQRLSTQFEKELMR